MLEEIKIGSPAWRSFSRALLKWRTHDLGVDAKLPKVKMKNPLGEVNARPHYAHKTLRPTSTISKTPRHSIGKKTSALSGNYPQSLLCCSHHHIRRAFTAGKRNAGVGNLRHLFIP